MLDQDFLEEYSDETLGLTETEAIRQEVMYSIFGLLTDSEQKATMDYLSSVLRFRNPEGKKFF